MKKITLLASMAMVAAAASAQYACDPSAATVLAKGKVTELGVIGLSEASQAEFKDATVYQYGPDNDTRNLWFWDNTLSAGDSSYPGVDDQVDGYVSAVVGSAGWSGAGYNEGAPGVNTSWWNANTRFHLAYMTSGTAPASIAIIIADGESDCGSVPAKIALGDAYVDNGATYPAVAPKASDDWQGIDISFADLKKLWPSFDFKAIDNWTGNIMSFLGGGVSGQTFAFDAIYFYQLEGGDGIADAVNDAEWVITDNTINVAGAQGIELFDLSGKLVKSTAGTTLGISNVAGGLYIAKAGNAVRKVAVK
ncbi:MAG: T9SS type A sorting domain-containing protein [Bacteroidales bacterium]|nr:T9SS type A sorting domain-containing protein [Bacteroidales bacterium]